MTGSVNAAMNTPERCAASSIAPWLFSWPCSPAARFTTPSGGPPKRLDKWWEVQAHCEALARHLAEATYWILTRREAYREPTGSAVSSTRERRGTPVSRGTGYTPRAGPPGVPRNKVTRNTRRLTPQCIDRRRADIHAGTPGPAEEQSCAARLAGDHNPRFPPRARRNRKRIRRATIGRP